VTIVGLVDSATVSGTTLTNLAQVNSANEDPASANNTDIVTTTVEQWSRVTISKQATPATSTAGSELTYQIVVTNAGPSLASGVVVNDALPAGFTATSISSSQGNCSALPCAVGDLAAGATVVVTIRGAVESGQTSGLLNSASLTATTPVTGITDTTLTTPVATSADLSLVLASTPTSIAGTTAVVTATVTNAGPSDAAGAVVTLTLPASTTLNSASLPTGWFVIDNGDGTVTLTTTNALAPNETVMLPVTVDVASGVTPGTSLEFQGVAASSTSDPNLSNNVGNSDTSVVSSAALSIRKTSDPAAVNAGELVTYTITITNSGPSDARFVDVKEQLPTGLTLQSIIASDGGACAGTLCQFGTVTQHATRTVTVVARVASNMTGVVTNTAAVDSIDNAAGIPVTATATTTITAAATLRITKTALNEPVNAGGVALYQIVVTNDGPSDAQNVVVTDTLPVSTTYAGGDADCAATGPTVVCNVGTLAAGATLTLLVQVNVNPHIPAGTVITNSAVASSPTAVLTATATATSTVAQPADGVADVQIAKHGPATVTAGERITYTLVVTNRGPASAQDVQIVDALPDGVTYLNATASQGTCAAAVNCQLGNLALNATATVTIVGLVDSATVSGTVLTNLAQVNSANEDPASANNTDIVTTTVEQWSRLTMSKHATPATAVAGSELTYQIVVTNAGPSMASGVVVNDALPAGFVLDSITSSQGNCSALPCIVGDLAAGATVVVTIRGTVESGQTNSLANSASITATTPVTGATATTLTTSVATSADLSLVLASTPTSIAGTTAVVTATVTNAGPSDAAGAVVTLTLPASTTLNSAALPAGWFVIDNGDGIVTLTTTNALAPNETIVLPVTVDIASGVTPGTSLEFGGSVGSATSDPDLTNNTDNSDTSVVSSAALSIRKTSDPAAVNAGELVTYTITITNSGPSDARFVDVKEQLPAGLTLHSITASDGGACAQTLCQFGTVPDGATRTVTVVARVASAVTGVVTNTAAVDSIDNAAGVPVTAMATTTITAAATLRMTKTALHEPVVAGGVALYQIVVTNDGPSDAQNVVVTDTLPVSTTYAGGDAACTANGDTVVCTVGTLAAGATRTLLVQVNVNLHIPAGTVITNAVVASSPTAALPTTATATNTVAQPADGVADVQIAKHGPVTVTAGERITYTLVVTNIGPAPAQDVQIVDALPDGVSFVNATASQGLCQAGISCQLGNLAVGATAAIVVVGVVDSQVVSGALLVNQAQVNSANEDPQAVDNTAATTATVHAFATVTLHKAVTPATAQPGDTVVYRIVVTNSGPSAARDVFVSDPLPAALLNAQVSSTPAGCTDFPCALGDLTPGAAATILVVGQLAPEAAGLVSNTATLSSATSLAPASTTTATATFIAEPVADVAIFKDAAATMAAGNVLTYTLVAVNYGPSQADAVVIVDTLPAGVTLIDGGGCAANGLTVTCTVGILAAGARTTATLVVLTANTLLPGTSLANRATVAASTIDPDQANNVATVDTSLVAQAAFTIAKQQAAPAGAVIAGELVTYTITITNHGPSQARGVDVKDQLPAGLSLVSMNAGQGVCASGICQFGALAVGATRTVTVVARADANATGVVTNTAAVYSTDMPEGVTATAPTTITAAAALRLEKTALNQVVNAGETLLYLVAVSNDGPSTAQAVRITDTLPAYLTFVGGDSACTASGQTVTCNVGTLAAGATRSLLIQARANALTPDGMTVTNLVTATSPTGATVVATATATIVQPTAGAADLVISKEGPATAVAGMQIVYTLVVTNRGPAMASGVQVVDAVPSELTVTAVRSSQGACNQSVICQIGAMNAGAVVRIVITAAVQSNVLTGTLLTNVAQVGSANVDPTPENNTASATTTVLASVQLHIDKVASPAVVAPGGQIVYRIVVTNSGPSLAHNVVVTDLLPAAVLNPFVSSSQGGCTGFPCALGDLPAGAAATILVNGIVAQDATGSIVNVAQAGGGGGPSGGAVVTDTVSVAVQPLADVTLAKQASPTAVAGQGIAYTLTVRNNGPSAAVAVVVTDTAPAGVTVSAAPGCTISGATVVCVVGVLAAGEARTFMLGGSVDANIPPGASLENRAVATSSTPDPDPTNNQANADTSILRVADLALAKQGPTTVVAGEYATYVITVVNNGPSAAGMRDIKDTLPPGMSLVGAQLATASGELTACAGGICQTAQPLPVGAVATMTVLARVDAATPPGSVLTNTATVLPESNSTDPNLSNNLGQAAAVVNALASLRIDKYDLVDPVEPDGIIAYVIVVTNTGPSDARGVVIRDALPAGVTFQSSTGGCVETPAGMLMCSVGQLAAGQQALIQVFVRVSRAMPSGSVLTNTVTLTATTPLTNSLLAADEPTLVVARPGILADLEVQKHALTPLAQAGGLVTFTMVVTNHGPSPATNVQLLDVLPTGLTLVSATPSQGFCDTGVNCALGALDFQANASGAPILKGTATVTVVARVLETLQSAVVLTNTVYVNADQQDPTPENNIDTASVSTVAQFTDVRILKGAAPTVTNGSLLTYTLLVINDGPATAYDVTVRDPLPFGATYVSASPAPAGGLPTAPFWTLGSLAAGEQRTLLMTVRVDAGAATGILLQNTAGVTTTTPELSLANNTATVTTQGFALADVAIEKSTAISYAVPGEVVTYTIVVTNYGPSTATEVDVKEVLPPGMWPIDVTAGQGVCVSQICQLGDVPVGGTVTITVTATADGSITPGTILTNTAAVFTGTPDPDPDNNTDTAPIIAGPVVTLQALKRSEVPSATVGSLITYSIIITNLGPSLAPQIIVTDNTPAGFQFVAGTAVNGCVAINPAHVVCDAGPLPAGQSVHFRLVFYIVSASQEMVQNSIWANAPGTDEPTGGAGDETEVPIKPNPSAILLAQYEIFTQEDGLLLVWETLAEFYTWGFNIWRSPTPNRAAATLLNPAIIPARGGGSSYSHLDRSAEPGVTYWYWLQEVTVGGLTADYGVVSGRMPGTSRTYLPLVAGGVQSRAAEPAATPNSIYLPLVTEGNTAATAAEAPTATPTPTPTPTPLPTAAPSPTVVDATPTPGATAIPAAVGGEAATASATPTPSPSPPAVLAPATPAPSPSSAHGPGVDE
jgi:uncharacterized repeat protein (TIGR01451 family)